MYGMETGLIILVKLSKNTGPTERLDLFGKSSFFFERAGTSQVTWLILPVVICLSQRLSHACLSTSLTKVKPRMAH